MGWPIGLAPPPSCRFAIAFKVRPSVISASDAAPRGRVGVNSCSQSLPGGSRRDQTKKPVNSGNGGIHRCNVAGHVAYPSAQMRLAAARDMKDKCERTSPPMQACRVHYKSSTMNSRTLDGKNSMESPKNWPDLPPRELAVRLADALQYESCGPQDLWDEISDWLARIRVVPPHISPLHIVTPETAIPGSRKFLPRTQEASALQITRLIYASKHKGPTSEVIDKILRESEVNNVRDNVTGALLVDQDKFLQLIEGGRLAVSQCFMRIMQDSNHHDIQVISCGDVSQRLFQKWSMYMVKTSQVNSKLMSAFGINGAFNPAQMSEFAIEDLCRTLAHGNWQADAA